MGVKRAVFGADVGLMPKPARSARPEMPRQSERFLTTALVCPLGDVLDVSREGLRLSSGKKFPFKQGEIHQLVLRADAQQVRVMARAQWVKRASLLPPRFEAGFLIVDPRPGVGVAVLQMGQFGCAATESVDATSTEEARRQTMPKIRAAVELEDLYAVLGVEADADGSAIKRAYRKLAQTHHPDRSDAADAAEVFDRIAKAYSVLGDAQRRRWYDQMRAGDLVA